MAKSRNETAQEFLTFLFDPIPDDSCIEIRVKQNNKPGTRQLFITDPSLVRVDQYPPDTHVWFGVCLRGRGAKHGRRGELTFATCVWADFDSVTNKEQKVLELRRFPHPPSVIVDSGGGLHAYWKLNRPLDLRDDTQATYVREVVHGLAYALGGDLSVHDLTRLLRLPATYNPGNSRTKVYNPPRETRVVH